MVNKGRKFWKLLEKEKDAAYNIFSFTTILFPLFHKLDHLAPYHTQLFNDPEKENLKTMWKKEKMLLKRLQGKLPSSKSNVFCHIEMLQINILPHDPDV